MYLSKVDLTSGEAEATVGMWEEQLSRLRKVSTLRSLNKQIQAAQSVPAVRIRAYRNGEGSHGEPVLVIGATIDSVSTIVTKGLFKYHNYIKLGSFIATATVT